jgi:type IV pilus assembly protein PilM
MADSTIREFLRIPRQDRYATGIDIGTRAVKVVTVRRGRGKTVKVVSRVREEIPPGPQETYRDRKVAALRKALLHHRGSLGWVVVALPRDMTSERIINLPAVDRSELTEMVRFDAERHIPFPIDQVEVTHKVLRVNENHTSDVMLVAARHEDLDSHLSLLQEAGVEPDYLCVSVAGCARVFSLQGFDGDSVGVLDLGERRTDLAIFRGKQIVFSRALHTGAKRLRAIAKKMETGEDLPAGPGDAPWSQSQVPDRGRPPSEREAPLALRGEGGNSGFSPDTWNFDSRRSLEKEPEGIWLDELLAELQRTIQAYRYEVIGENLDRLILCGGLAHAVGLDERIEERLQIETLAAEDVVPDCVDSEKIGPLDPEMAAALGIALEVAVDGSPSVNLLPQQILDERSGQRRSEFRKQVVTFLVMIAILLAGVAYTDFKTLSNMILLKEEQIRNLDKQIAEVEVLQKELDIMNTLRDTEHSAYRVLEATCRRSPDNIEIIDLVFSKQDRVEMNCRIETSKQGGDFVRELSQDSVFDPDRSSMENSRPDRVEGVELQQFKVSLGLRIVEKLIKEPLRKETRR